MGSFIFFVLSIALATLASAQLYTFANKRLAIKYASIDIDVKETEENFDLKTPAGFTSANRIYVGGSRAIPRTLKKLSSNNDRVMSGEPTFVLFKNYWGSGTYADDAITQIIFKRGAYAIQSDPFRADAGIKFIQYHSVWMWVIHQMEVAVKLCQSKQSKARVVQNWDFAVADYMGSEIIRSEENSGYLLHTLAVKRCSQFGNCVRLKNGVTRASINNKIYLHFRVGKNALNRGACGGAKYRKNRVIQLMYAPLVQACIRYIVRTKLDSEEASKQKTHAEGWAFCAAFLPKLQKCSRYASNLIIEQLGPRQKNPMKKSPSQLMNAIYSNFKCMGFKCRDVGNYIENPGYPKCKDT